MNKVLCIIIILFYFFAVIGGFIYGLVKAWPLSVAIAGLAAMAWPVFKDCWIPFSGKTTQAKS